MRLTWFDFCLEKILTIDFGLLVVVFKTIGVYIYPEMLKFQANKAIFSPENEKPTRRLLVLKSRSFHTKLRTL